MARSADFAPKAMFVYPAAIMMMRFLLPALVLLAFPASAQLPPVPPLAEQPRPAPARPEWTAAAAADLLEAVRAAEAEGISPEDHGQTALAAALRAADPETIATVATASYLSLARVYLRGQAPASARLRWHLAAPRANPSMLRITMDQALRTGAVRQSLEAMLPTHPHYAALRQSLAATTDPEFRAILRANMDRWRWMPRRLGETHILVNVPTFEASLVQDGQTIATHRVIVGKLETPTPQFSSMAKGITLNPRWVVPQSIIRRTVGPLIRRSPSTARARGFTWTSSGGRLHVTQAPGPENSLGQMRIDMPNPFTIFLHDTPAKALFDKEVRAFSHGCIRTDRALELAGILLADVPGWDAARIAGVVETRQTTRIPLARQIPVHIVYFTAVPDQQGKVLIHPDIYGRDAPVIAALTREASDSRRPELAASDCQAEIPNLPA